MTNNYTPVSTLLQRQYLRMAKTVKPNIRIIMSKSCPKCKAGYGFYCITDKGNTAYKPHLSRQFN